MYNHLKSILSKPQASYLVNTFIIILLVLATILINLRMIRDGLNGLADLRWHITWIQHFSKQLAEGIWYPRWLAGTNFGYGSPTFVFYPPFVYYIASVIKLMGFNIEQTISIMFSLGIFFSGLTFYIYSYSKWGKLPAFVGSLFYMSSPVIVIYVNGGVLANLFALPLIPLGLYLTDKAIVEPKTRFFLALFWIILPLIHTPSLLLYSIAWFLYTLFFLLKHSWKIVVPIWISAALGLGVASIYLLPAIIEQSFVNINYPIISKKGFVYVIQFGELFQKGFSDVLFFQQIIAIAVMTIIGLICVKQNSTKVKETWCWVGAAIFVLLLMSNWSWLFWQSSSTLQKVQTSWRLAGLFYFAEAALCALVVSNILRFPLLFKNFSLIIIASIILMNGKFGYQQTRAHPTLHNPGRGKVFVREWIETALYNPYSDKLIDVPEYRPLLDNSIPLFYPRERYTDSGIPKEIALAQKQGKSPLPTPKIGQSRLKIISGKAEIKLEHWKSYDRQFKVTVLEPSTIRIRTYYYPAWHLYVNNKPYSFKKADDGTIELTLEPGFYNVELLYQKTPAFIAGITLSLLSLGVLVWLGIKSWGQSLF